MILFAFLCGPALAADVVVGPGETSNLGGDHNSISILIDGGTLKPSSDLSIGRFRNGVGILDITNGGLAELTGLVLGDGSSSGGAGEGYVNVYDGTLISANGLILAYGGGKAWLYVGPNGNVVANGILLGDGGSVGSNGISYGQVVVDGGSIQSLTTSSYNSNVVSSRTSEIVVKNSGTWVVSNVHGNDGIFSNSGSLSLENGGSMLVATYAQYAFATMNFVLGAGLEDTIFTVLGDVYFNSAWANSIVFDFSDLDLQGSSDVFVGMTWGGTATGLNENLFNFGDWENYDADKWSAEKIYDLVNGKIGVQYTWLGAGPSGEDDEPQPENPSGTPEPATLLMLGLGLGAIPFARRFRKK